MRRNFSRRLHKWMNAKFEDIKGSSRIIDRSALDQLAADARAHGKRIVLANGCFDILHVGHVRYLQGAKAEGDLLIVGINSDEQVRKQKGNGRPLISQNERAELVAAIEAVDVVTSFDEPTVGELLLALKPD